MLNTNAFDNNRKRTSVVVRTPGGGGGGWGGATLLVKGADTCVMPFVDRANGACPYFDQTQVRRLSGGAPCRCKRVHERRIYACKASTREQRKPTISPRAPLSRRDA